MFPRKKYRRITSGHHDLTLNLQLIDIVEDSFEVVEIVFALEEEFDVDIPDQEVRSVRTIGDLVQRLEKLTAKRSSAKSGAELRYKVRRRGQAARQRVSENAGIGPSGAMSARRPPRLQGPGRRASVVWVPAAPTRRSALWMSPDRRTGGRWAVRRSRS